MRILLPDYHYKEVTITLGNGESYTGTICKIKNCREYYLSSVVGLAWNEYGQHSASFRLRDYHIVKIVETTPIQMNNKEQLLQSIKDTEAQLNKLKEQLEQQKAPTIQEAVVGDTLEDGSIVLKKENGLALLVAPKSTEVWCQWTKQFSEVFDKLNSKGFIPSQWFIPTAEQLLLAYAVLPSEFNKKLYWSSSEYTADMGGVCNFVTGVLGNVICCNTLWVRSFRCISY
jgi:hypothetical protein